MPVTMADLMHNVAAELEAMAQRCRALEDEALGIVGHAAVDEAQRHRLLMVFQGLDLMIQALSDLGQLAGAGVTSGLASLTVDPQVVRQRVKLQSLADRLLGTSAPGGAEGRPTDFLL